jgi:hypothetical protein
MPISLETVEQKLHERYFNNMSELESYVKRMVQNAKDYYSKTSQIFEDAERVRKALSNYMVKTNPAYKLIPNYTATATPLPPDDGMMPMSMPVQMPVAALPAQMDMQLSYTGAPGLDEDAEGEEDEDAGVDSDDSSHPGRNNHQSRGSVSASSQKAPPSGSSKPDHEYEGVPYGQLSFQQAQEKIVEELIRKPDEE